MNDSFNSELSNSFTLHEESFQEIQYNIISTITSSLLQVISTNQNSSSSLKSENNPFVSNPLPLISLNEYLSRICHYTNLSKEALRCALIYIDNICLTNKILLTDFTVHKVLLSAILLSIKYNEDNIYSMDYYAEIFGISKEELLTLELEFIIAIDFKMYIKEEIYFHYEQTLINQNINDKNYETPNSDEDEIYLTLADRNTVSSCSEVLL